MKALALFSGGLDSTLAIKIILNEGIKVKALHFLTPFSYCDKEQESLLIKKFKEKLNTELELITLNEDYLEILKNPKFGYGKNLNPCIDCKILMLKRTKQMLEECGASFIVTGEVVGQRPKSQHKDTLRLIEKQASLEGFILRPLSAKILPPTIAEINGWVNREHLFTLHGRNRKPQMQLAKSLGIKDYSWPGGGCLLTVSSFCGRIKDLFEHKECSLDNIELLQLGRHFRITPSFKLVVGRDEKENTKLLNLAKAGDLIFEPKELPGPTAIGRGIFNDNTKILSGQIIARYTLPINEEVKIIVRPFSQNKEEVVTVASISEDRLRKLII
jgi:hypothetical protein